MPKQAKGKDVFYCQETSNDPKRDIYLGKTTKRNVRNIEHPFEIDSFSKKKIYVEGQENTQKKDVEKNKLIKKRSH